MKNTLSLALISALILSCGTKKITTKTHVADKTITVTDSSAVSSTSDRTLIDLSKHITLIEEITESVAEVRDSSGRVISPARTITKKRQISATDKNVALSVRDSCSAAQVSESKRADVVSSTSEVVRSKPLAWGWVVFWGGVLVVIGVAVRWFLRF